MKKLLFLLVLIFAVSCAEDDGETEPEQDYTSFTFIHHEDVVLPNCVIGYYKDGLCLKIAEIGDLSKDKISPEIIVEDPNIVDIYLFSDYLPMYGDNQLWVKKIDATYTLKAKSKNNFELDGDASGILVDKYDPTQYPH
jgi:hypothetical protein